MCAEISVTDGGGQFKPVFSSGIEPGLQEYDFSPVKGSEIKISITEGLAFFESISCDAIK